MAGSTKDDAKAKAQADADAMFGEPDEADLDDLLNEVEEDDSEGWNPTEKGEAVAGVVLKVSEIRSDFADPNDPDEEAMCPVVTIKTASGEKYRIIGYGAVLKREIRDANPEKGDRFAVKYFGEKPIKKGRFAGKNYKHYGVACRKPGQ